MTDDLISRQQAIDALRGYLVEKRCPDDGTLTCRLIENEVINKLPSVQPEQRWIPVSEKLPGFGQRVLVSTANFVYEAIYFDEDAGWSTYNVSFKDVDESEILAWMPLPEPYKGEQDG